MKDMLACLWVCTGAGYGVRERGGSYATEVRDSLSLRESLSRNKGTLPLRTLDTDAQTNAGVCKDKARKSQ